MPELLLAIDAGTTTARACLFTPGGDLLARAAAPVRTTTPAPGRVEQDAERVWRGVRMLSRRVLATVGRSAADLAGIGVTSQRTSLVLWDRATGHPLGPMVVWSDLRGIGRARALQAVGLPLSPQQAATKLEGVIDAAPEGRSLMRQGRLAWGNIDAFLIWKLTGGAAHVTDRSQAWPTGYLDPRTLDWNHGLLELQGLDRRLFPELVDTWGPLAVTDQRILGAAVPISAVIADQQSALIGHGAEAAGEAKITYGTSATFDLSTGERLVHAGGASLPPFISRVVAGQPRWCVEAMVYAAGSGLDWMRHSFRLGGHERFERSAASVPDSGGVAVLPAFQGLGAPYADLSRRAAITGLSAASTPAHIARAALAGLAFRVREAVTTAFAKAGQPPPEQLRVDGGLTGNDLLMQLQADLSGLPVVRHAHLEATACGAAVCAARGVGLLGPEEVGGFARYDRTFEPRLSRDETDARFSAWRAQVYGEGA